MIVDGVVLAGGASRRMGRDKATLVVDGERLVDRAVVTLGRLGGEVVVASGNRTIGGLTVPQVQDRLPDAGPLTGIEAGLDAARTELVAVLAVDTAAPSEAVFEALAGAWDGASPAVVAEVGGVLQPLHACWARSTLPHLSAALDRGERSPTRFLTDRSAQVVGRSVWGGLDPDGGFARSLNRPDDLGT